MREVVPSPSRRMIAQAVDLIVQIARRARAGRVEGLLHVEGLDEAGGYVVRTAG